MAGTKFEWHGWLFGRKGLSYTRYNKLATEQKVELYHEYETYKRSNVSGRNAANNKRSVSKPTRKEKDHAQYSKANRPRGNQAS
jgi:hypothetical protein